MDSKRDLKKKEYLEKRKLNELKVDQSKKIKKLYLILKKNIEERSNEENNFIEENKSFIKHVETKISKQNITKNRLKEFEDDFCELEKKIELLKNMIDQAKHIVVYTGAGISTSAEIPDYRGPNGVWTKFNKESSLIKTQDLAKAIPTYTHMALKTLIKLKIIKHIVSQNCDGLHLRSGIKQNFLSEIHGNMFIEVCLNCQKQYFRDFDVTELTSLRHHKTGRFCYDCKLLDNKESNYQLIDTIVHFGEKGTLSWPLNWKGAIESVNKTDLIICVGSSLKVLKKYSCLWPKNLNSEKYENVNLVIINLQWTPKDNKASLKINAKCDKVFELIMNKLKVEVDTYDKEKDLLKELYTPLNENEKSTCKRFQLFTEEKQTDMNNLIVPGWFGKGLKSNKSSR